MTDPITITLPGWAALALLILFALVALSELLRRGLELWVYIERKRLERARAARSWGVWLTNHGPRKINAIKAIREHTGLGLKKAKEASEARGLIVRGWPHLRAVRLADDLKEVGATAEAIRVPPDDCHPSDLTP